jgi:hypothetical protein
MRKIVEVIKDFILPNIITLSSSEFETFFLEHCKNNGFKVETQITDDQKDSIKEYIERSDTCNYVDPNFSSLFEVAKDTCNEYFSSVIFSDWADYAVYPQPLGSQGNLDFIVKDKDRIFLFELKTVKVGNKPKINDVMIHKEVIYLFGVIKKNTVYHFVGKDYDDSQAERLAFQNLFEKTRDELKHISSNRCTSRIIHEYKNNATTIPIQKLYDYMAK